MTETRAEGVEALCDPVLMDLGIEHGFGRRGSGVPDATFFPRQVHGTTVWCVESGETGTGQRSFEEEVEEEVGAEVEADAVVACEPGLPVGIVTADCVPLLASSADGSAVAAIHAGWRGLAAGVIERGLAMLQKKAPGSAIHLAIGPGARGCCYEVDEPVCRALGARYRAQLAGDVLRPVAGRAGRHLLDLSGLAERIVADLGIPGMRLGVAHRVCTICDPRRFESFRRDGAGAGRLRHFIRSV